MGFGNVARRFVRLLCERRATLEHDHQMSARVVGIVTRRHGHAFSAKGIDAIAIARRIERGEPIEMATSRVVSGRSHVASGFRRTPPSSVDGTSHVASGFSRTPPSSVDFIREATTKSAAAASQRRLVVLETTTLDIARGQPATAHVRAALAGGAHVITANKGPAALAYRALSRDAARANRRFLFEGTVMDGIPIFNLVRETLPSVTIVGFRGVVNSTTNFILTAMEQGHPFGEALAEMQARGIAEADATLDIDGWDAAAKAAALANVLLGARLTPRMVARRGLSPESGRQAVEARAAGQRVKLVARAERDGRRVTASVAPEELPGDDLLAGLEGQQNAIIFRTDLLGEFAVVQRGGGLTQTAYALVSDLVTIVRDVTGPAHRSATRASRRSRP